MNKKGLYFDFRKVLEKAGEKREKQSKERAKRGRNSRRIKREKKERKEKKNVRALRPKGAISSTGCASHSIINFVELLFRT